MNREPHGARWLLIVAACGWLALALQVDGRIVAGQQRDAAAADVVFRGGTVITVDPQDRIATAAAVVGNRIAEQLDRELPHHPVVLRWSAHDLLINHMANEMAGLGRGTPDPKGMGRIERAANGEPAILRDADVELPLPKPTADQLRQWLPLILRDFYLKRGVTTVYDMSSPHPEIPEEKLCVTC